MQCEAALLGREAVGAVDASALAALIRSLLQARERLQRAAGDLYRDRRRYVLRCGGSGAAADGLEIAPCPARASTAAASSPSPSSSPAPSSTSSTSTRPRRADDEGFESDDDTASTKSAASLDDTVSNSSSCCFIDDHVFKFSGAAGGTGAGAGGNRGGVTVSNSSSSNSSVATDSANSSGASDTDDVDSSGTPPSSNTGHVSKLVKSLTLYQHRANAAAPPTPPTRPEGGEVYPLTDIAFCHLDPTFPKVVVWVVKRKRPQRLSATPEGNNTGLQAIVFECANERALKKFCANFQEMSRRAKLDQYKHPHRRKDQSSAFSTLYRGYLPSMRESPREKQTPEMQIQAVENPKVVKLELELCKGNEVKANTSRIVKPKTLPKPVPPPVIQKEEAGDDLPVAAKFNLVQRTDGDGVTHIEVARGSSDASPPAAPRIETVPETASGPSSIISISTPDVGNLLTTSQRVSRLGKEIEGVIRSDVDAAAASSRREPPRQRQPAILVLNGDAVEELHKVWTPPEVEAALAVEQGEDEEDEDDDEDQKDVVVADPPQRPERRKYVRKKNPAPQPPGQLPPPPLRPSPSPDPFTKKPLVPYKPESLSRGQKIVRGQFIRVSVDQNTGPAVQQPWIFGSNYASGGWGGTDPTREHLPRRGLDDMFAIQGHSLRQHPPHRMQQQHRRSRSSTGGGGRSRSKSPPMTRRPMAYRYIDVANPPPPQPQPPTAGRFFGLSQKLKELSGGGGQSQQVHPGYATTARRRGSIGEASHLAAVGGQGCHLKSVIKKSKRAGEYVEPKKVTFSAYATVQVVD